MKNSNIDHQSEEAADDEGEAAAALPTQRRCPFDPPDRLGELQRTQPISRLRFPDGHVGWLVTNNEYARAVMMDSRFSNRIKRNALADDAKAIGEVFHTAHKEGADLGGVDLLHLDPPQHSELRRLLAGAFSVQRVSRLEGKIQTIVADQIAAMRKSGAPVDLVGMFSHPIALRSFCLMFGIAEVDIPVVRRFADQAKEEGQWKSDLVDYFTFVRRLIGERRQHPKEDLISYLVGCNELNEEKILGLSLSLLAAGTDTVTAMISLSACALMENPEERQKLVADPEAAPSAVEELLRYLSVFQAAELGRTAMQDVELAGHRITAGETVWVSLATANRDPTVFQNADRLDLHRPVVSHLAFGTGRHMCLGQHLARLELRIALPALFHEFPGLRLAIPFSEVKVKGERELLNGVETLPVTW